MSTGPRTGSLNRSQKNARMTDACNATKAEGVIVYTIGFEIPQNGAAETEISACATAPSHYYRASQDTISNAFSSIASNVQNLRLTQ